MVLQLMAGFLLSPISLVRLVDLPLLHSSHRTFLLWILIVGSARLGPSCLDEPVFSCEPVFDQGSSHQLVMLHHPCLISSSLMFLLPFTSAVISSILALSIKFIFLASHWYLPISPVLQGASAHLLQILTLLLPVVLSSKSLLMGLVRGGFPPQ